jgi:hypothetical protein
MFRMGPCLSRLAEACMSAVQQQDWGDIDTLPAALARQHAATTVTLLLLCHHTHAAMQHITTCSNSTSNPLPCAFHLWVQ